MNNRGQALVEFVIILPILIFTCLAVFDLGNIIVKKYALENDLDTIVNMYEIIIKLLYLNRLKLLLQS